MAWAMPLFMLYSIFAICSGACLGALLRWLFNLALNPLVSAFPLGTLAVNWLGSLIMGICLGFFALYPHISPQWKLFLITGFLGSLTTFSAFAGEIAAIIDSDRFFTALGVICLHVIGSILLVFLGMYLFKVSADLFAE